MLIDHGFQRILFAEGAGVFRAEAIEAKLGFVLFCTPAFDLPADLLNPGAQSRHGLVDRFELEGNLPALAAKTFNIHLGRGDFVAAFLCLGRCSRIVRYASARQCDDEPGTGRDQL